MRLIVLANQREAQAHRARGEEVPNIGPSPGVRDLRWHKPVFAGDTISYALEIKELREASRPGYGLVVSQTTGTNQAGDPVYSALGAVFVERRRKPHNAGAASGA
jgi:acyl dehydratase